jgi:hypothetical protein
MDLHTTNVLLGIMAAVSVLEALLLIGMGIGGYLVFSHITKLITDLEGRQIAPLREKVEAILADVKSVTARISEQTERVDQAIAGTMGRVDETAERVKESVRDKVNQAVGVVRGIRAILASIMRSDRRNEPPAAAAGRV